MSSQDMLTINTFEIAQNVGNFHVGVIEAKALFEVCKFDYRRIEEKGGYKDFLGIQRQLNEKRVKDIKKYLTTVDAVFPTSIVISVDERCAELNVKENYNELILKPFIDSDNNDISIQYENIATIIDGQHRLKAFEDPSAPSFQICVCIFVGVDDATEATIFSKVNQTQTKVNKSLVYDLFALDKTPSPEKSCHEIAVALDSLETSPFYERIKRLGTSTEGRFGETLSQATIVQGILPYISKDPMMDRDIGKRVGFWPEGDQEKFETQIFYEFFRNSENKKILSIIINYFKAIERKWPKAWNANGTGAVLGKTNGYIGLMRFLRDAFLHLTNNPRVVTEEEFFNLIKDYPFTDNDFITTNYPPGSSGSSKLYRDFKSQL